MPSSICKQAVGRKCTAFSFFRMFVVGHKWENQAVHGHCSDFSCVRIDRWSKQRWTRGSWSGCSSMLGRAVGSVSRCIDACVSIHCPCWFLSTRSCGKLSSTSVAITKVCASLASFFHCCGSVASICNVCTPCNFSRHFKEAPEMSVQMYSHLWDAPICCKYAVAPRASPPRPAPTSTTRNVAFLGSIPCAIVRFRCIDVAH